MKFSTLTVILVFFLIILMSSCLPQRNLEYVRTPVTDSLVYHPPVPEKVLIKPNDELYISVTSFDATSFDFFGSKADMGRTGFSNELSVSLISFTVDPDGKIFFPVLGKVQVGGSTLDQARDKLTKLLSDYFDQPSVVIKFAYKKVSVLGEVRVAGNFEYSKSRITIFDALAMAGDITTFGDRRDVIVIHNKNNRVVKRTVDLTNDKSTFSDLYYVQPDDIIYVKPKRSLTWNVVNTPLSIVLSAITASMLILNYFK